MSDGIPDRHLSKIEGSDDDDEVSAEVKKEIYRSFLRARRPMLTKSYINEEIDPSGETIKNGLDEMATKQILGKDREIAQDDLYWVLHPESEWPVGDDVIAGSDERRLFLKQVESDTGSQWIGVAILLLVTGSLFEIAWFALTEVGLFPNQRIRALGVGVALSVVGIFVLVWGLSYWLRPPS